MLNRINTVERFSSDLVLSKSREVWNTPFSLSTAIVATVIWLKLMHLDFSACQVVNVNVTAILKCYRVNVQNANSLQTNRSETASAFVFFKMTWYCVAESSFQSLRLIFCINVYVWSKTNEQDQAKERSRDLSNSKRRDKHMSGYKWVYFFTISMNMKQAFTKHSSSTLPAFLWSWACHFAWPVHM